LLIKEFFGGKVENNFAPPPPFELLPTGLRRNKSMTKSAIYALQTINNLITINKSWKTVQTALDLRENEPSS
jgi:hypothetical protein